MAVSYQICAMDFPVNGRFANREQEKERIKMAILDSFSLEGKIALVTGASYGIGFAIASAYAEAGATIVFNDIKQELVDKGMLLMQKKVSKHTAMYVMLPTRSR